MAATDRNTLKGWFIRGAKPLASQFAAWIDSFWHKDDKIPADSVEGLTNILTSKVDRDAVINMIAEAILNQAYPEASLTQKGIVKLTSTPSLADEANAATPKLVHYATSDAVARATEVVEDRINTLKGGVPVEGDTLKKLYDLIVLLQNLVASNDVNLDTVQEIVTFIKNNKDVIDTISTTKVNIADIVDNLTSTDTNKPLSAKQGKVLKEMISSSLTKFGTVTGDAAEVSAVVSNCEITKLFIKHRTGAANLKVGTASGASDIYAGDVAADNVVNVSIPAFNGATIYVSAAGVGTFDLTLKTDNNIF